MSYLIVRILRKFGILKKLNLQVNSSINNVKIKVPLLNGFGFDNLHIIEFWMCGLIKKVLLQKKGVFIDVGINIGQTLIKLKTIDKNIEYIGFEPNPKCVNYANELVSLNGFTNCSVIPVGIFNENKVLALNFFSEDNTDPSASVIENFRPEQKVFKKIFVPVFNFATLNAALHIDDIAVIKIDVEGAELEVLQSMQETINEKRPFIIIEILPCYNTQNVRRIQRQQTIETLLHSINYKIARIIKKDANSIDSYQPLAEIGIHGKIELCDYVLIPEELTTHFF